MKTKYEIIEDATSGIFDERECNITGLSNAMDEYAQQQAIAFSQWQISSNLAFGVKDCWYDKNGNHYANSTIHLYERFLQSQQTLNNP